jgi:hypothetical protein
MSNNKPRILISNHKKKFTQLILSSVIDWAVGIKSYKKIGNPTLEWDSQQRKFLDNLLAHNPDFLDQPLFKNSYLKKYILKVIKNGLSKEDVETFYKNRDQFPLNLLGLEIGLLNFVEKNKGQLISTAKVDSGFYMLEAMLSSEHLVNVEQLVISAHDSNHQFEIKTIKNRVFKRLIYLPSDTKLSIKGIPKLNYSDLSQFKLVPITRNFFLSRLLKKLGKTITTKKMASMTDAELLNLWTEYDALFIGKDTAQNYEHFLEKIEPALIPPKETQLSQLKIWRIKAK